MCGYGTIEAALKSKTNPLSSVGLGFGSAREIAFALREQEYDLMHTVWEKYMPKQKA